MRARRDLPPTAGEVFDPFFVREYKLWATGPRPGHYNPRSWCPIPIPLYRRGRKTKASLAGGVGSRMFSFFFLERHGGRVARGANKTPFLVGRLGYPREREKNERHVGAEK